MGDATATRRMGKYVVERRLAFGGMAEVFLAKLPGADGFSKQVVIKRILPQHASDPRFVEMFRFEASLTSRLQHGNIAQVVELGEDDGQLYLVLEYVDGPSLREVLARVGERQERLSVAEAAFVADQIARALDYAHRKRRHDGRPLHVVHRDVSPSNILISREGEVKLTDFGVARARETTDASRTGTVKGKAEYLAPETIQHGIVNARSDLFGLGAVLWEMLTGRPAFAADTSLRAMFNVVSREPEPPSEINPAVPGSLDAVVMRLLEKDPTRRQVRGADVARALEPFQQTSVPANEILADTIARAFAGGRKPHEASGSHTAWQRFPVVLVVDQSPTFRAVVKAKLGDRVRVVEAATLDDARRLLQRDAPDLVLCQRFVGDSPGLDLCREMHDAAARVRFGFVLIVTDVAEEVRAAAAAAGARSILPKSATAAELLSLLDDVGPLPAGARGC